jgi:hypothetical protein
VKTKNFVLLILGIVLIAGAIGGAFLGGEAVGNNNAKTTLAQAGQNLIGQFGANGPGQFGANATRPQGAAGGAAGGGGRVAGGAPPFAGAGGVIGGAGFGGGTIGTVQNVQGNTVTVTAQNGSAVTVMLSANTTIEKLTHGTVGDVAAGSNITVGGPRNTDGSIQAVTILLN